MFSAVCCGVWLELSNQKPIRGVVCILLNTAIQWEDVDFDSGILTINKNLYYKNQSNYRFVEPKTKASVRHIVLDECTLNILSEWKNDQQDLIKTDFVMSYNGIPTQKHTLAHAIERYAKLAGIHRIRIHGLRHPYVKPTTKKFITFFEVFRAAS